MAEYKPNYTSIDWFVRNSFLGKSAKGNYKGFLKQNRFGVRFELPNVASQIWPNENHQNIAEYMENNVVSVETPALSLSDEETPLRHHIGQRSTDNISIQFFEDPIISIKHAIWRWMDHTVRHRSDLDNFERDYLDNIKATLKVYPILFNGDIAPRYDEFSYVFPVATSPVTYDISEENAVGRVNVTFKYRYHNIRDATTGFVF